MGAFAVLRRLTSAALCAAVLSGCSSSIVYDAYQMARAHYRQQHLQQQRLQSVEEYLTARYQRVLRESLPPGTPIEAATCPHIPDPDGYEIETCWMAAGSRRYPIRVARNPIDRRLNSALGVTPMTRRWMQKRVAQLLYSSYGIAPQVRCQVPSRFIPAAGSSYSCSLRGSNAIASKLTAVFPIASYWMEIVASPAPPDERVLHDALRADAHRVPGRIVAGIIYARDAALIRKYGPSIRASKVTCPKFLDLRPHRAVKCELSGDFGYATQVVTMIRDRLAFHSEGAVIGAADLKRDVLAQLRKQYAAGKAVRAGIDCGPGNEIFVAPMAYRYCEISGPPQYPKRLAIATMDPQGHYEIFFTNFSQSAYST